MLDVNIFQSMSIGLASPEKIRSWSHGEVKKPETINYRTLKPERDGLFCERIFGPTRDWECHCGKYKRVRFKGTVCDRCGVEVTRAKVRRERMGHIELAAPVSHIWYFKGIPSRMGLLLDMSPRALERVLYFGSYIVLDGGETGLAKKEVLTEGQYRLQKETYGKNALKVGMGAEAIMALLRDLDLETMSETLREEVNCSNGQKRVRAIRRLEVVEAFRKSGNRPEWMILTVLPVIAPELRPMVQLDGGRFATSDLNDLYRRVINRNNRLRRLLKLKAPDIIVRNEKRMLQEAVDSLIDNGRRGRPVTGPGNRPLKSLSDMLKGKQGRFRQNLLGKRVDYSGRSVIVVGPELKLHQCGLPKEMALELFKPFVMKKLSADSGLTIKAAKKKVERATEDVWAVLEEVIKEHPVLLNRAPTLHRLGIQAFEPVLTEGRALKLHPLACTAYNADFDGDQMAIHLPLSAEAQAEARILMLCANHILAPKDGKPIIVPTQDMVLGTYFLTKIRNENEDLKKFSSFHEALLAYETNRLSLQQEILVMIPMNKQLTLVRTTVGRLIFNEKLPQPLRHFENHNGQITLGKVMDKKALSKLVADCFKKFGATKTAAVIDEVKRLGYHYACLAGITVGLEDVIVPPQKKDILNQTAAAVKKVEALFNRGILTERERYNKVVELWKKATELVAEAMLKNMDPFNPLFMMSDSGARGNTQQMRQLAGMRGLMNDPSGKTIEVPITANFREGLSVSDYFISSHGARKGLADTALRTADSGYLTRRLVDVAQDLIVRQDDCDISNVKVPLIRAELSEEPLDALEILNDALIGRVTAADVTDIFGDVILPKDTTITDESLLELGQSGAKTLTLKGCLLSLTPQRSSRQIQETIRLGTPDPKERAALKENFFRRYSDKPLAKPLTVHKEEYPTGTILDRELLKKILSDETVGVFSVRNLTIRGLEVETIYETKPGAPTVNLSDDCLTIILDDKRGVIEPLKDRIIGRTLAEDIYNKHGEKIAALNELLDEDKAEEIVRSFEDRRRIKIADGKFAEDIYDKRGQIIFKMGSSLDGQMDSSDSQSVNQMNRSTDDKIDSKNSQSVHLPISPSLTEDKVLIRSVLTCKSHSGVCKKCYGQDLANATEVEIGEAVGIIAAQSIGEPGTQLTMRTFHTGGVAGGDITQGLPRVEELFEARKPKFSAIISEIDGTATIEKTEKDDRLQVTITPDDLENHFPRQYLIPYGIQPKVKHGQKILAGTPITDGPKNPHDILRICGLKETNRYLVKEVQKVYKSQGVEINDKHIEVMVRQMLHKVKIEESGSTEFLPGEFVDMNVFEAANTKAIEEDGAPAVAKPILLGITKASLATDSFLSAASFQETTRVLTDAAIKGKVDPLIGLKENVIIGKLIPAGTGMARYRELTVVDNEAAAE